MAGAAAGVLPAHATVDDAPVPRTRISQGLVEASAQVTPQNLESLEDTEAPTVTFTRSADILDITDGPAKVKITAHAYDGGVGIRSDAETTLNWKIYRNSSTDPHRGTFQATEEYPQYSPENDVRGWHWLLFSQIPDANGNTAFTNDGGRILVATRPLRGNRPELRTGEGTVTASWIAHEDLVGILEYEAEFAGTGGVHTVRTNTTEASKDGLPAGTYTARVRARNQLGWGEWTAYSEPLVHTLAALTGSTPTTSGKAAVGEMLSTAAGDWTPGTTFRYQWLADGAPVAGATAATLLLGPEHAGRAVSVRVTGARPGYTPATRTSEPTAKVASAPLDVSTPAVSGTGSVGQTLRVATGSWTPGTTFKYQWLADGVALAGAAASTLLLGPEHSGKAISVRVTGSLPGYRTTSKTSAATAAVANFSLSATPAPTVTGTAKVGSTLTANPGRWLPAPVKLRYQWYRSGVAIIGATAATRKLTAADAASTLTVQVTGSRPGYATAVMSSAPTPVVAEASLAAALPTITGTAKVGSALTADPGTWAPRPDTFRYQWYRSGAAVIGATSATRKLTAADTGKTLTVKVTGSRTGYATTARTSAATAVVAQGSLLTAAPRITGSARVGAVLTADPGTWGPSRVTLRYHWYRSGRAIIGANGATYKIRSADAGKSIRVKVTGSRAGYAAAARTSPATAAVAKAALATTTPTITGTARVGSVLTAHRGSWGPAPLTFRYHWYRSGRAIIGANAAAYKIRSADAGATVSVRVTASRAGYTTALRTSQATAVVRPYNTPAPAPYQPPVSYQPPAPHQPSVPYQPPAPVAYYANCDAVRGAGAAPLYASQPGYRPRLDRDRDGVACE